MIATTDQIARLREMFATPGRQPERLDVGGDRHYRTSAGTYPGVTSILAATYPAERRRRLEIAASRRTPAELAEQEARRLAAADRGNKLHADVEAWAKDPFGIASDYAARNPWFASLAPFLRNTLMASVAVEVPVFSQTYGYAGTADMIGVITPGVLALIDWKTSDAPKARARISDYELQAAAYAYAVCEMAGERAAERTGGRAMIANAAIVMAHPDAPATVYWLSGREMQVAFGRFLNRLTEYQIAKAKAPPAQAIDASLLTDFADASAELGE